MEAAKKPSYKYCIVPKCNNTTRKTPDKRFFRIPSNPKVRQQWCKVMRRGDISPLSCLYCCEDHFNIKEDTANYIQFNIMKEQGLKCSLRLKTGVLPHIFSCRDQSMPPPVERMGAVKRERLTLVNEALSEFAINTTVAGSARRVPKPFKRKHDSNIIIKSEKMDVTCNNHIEANEKHIDNTVDSENDDKPHIEDDDLQDAQNKNNQNSAALMNILRCKCCLDTDKLKSMWQVYHCDGYREVYGSMLIDCFALPWVKPEDPLSVSDLICESCIVRLKDALRFKTEILTSEQLLNSEVNSVKHEIKQESDEVEEMKAEYLYFDDDFHIDEERSDDNDKYHSDDDDKDVIEKEDIKNNVKKENLLLEKPQEESKETSRRKRNVPKKYKQYSEEDLQKAVDAVVNTHMSQHTAAKTFKVPRYVLGSAVKKKNGRTSNDKRPAKPNPDVGTIEMAKQMSTRSWNHGIPTVATNVASVINSTRSQKT